MLDFEIGDFASEAASLNISYINKVFDLIYEI
jgi:hypothetical protein